MQQPAEHVRPPESDAIRLAGRRRDFACLLPAASVCVAAVFVLAVYRTLGIEPLDRDLLKALGHPGVPPDYVNRAILESAPDEPARALTVRYAWGCSAVAVFFLLSASLAHITWRTWTWWKAYPHLRRRLPLMLIPLAALAALLLQPWVRGIFPTPPLESLLDPSFTEQGMHNAARVSWLMNGAAAVYLLALTKGAVTTAYASHESREISELAEYDNHLRWMIYGGAAILTAAVFEIGFLYQIPAGAHDGSHAPFFRQIASTIAGGAGFILSLFLFSIYLPAALQIRHAGRRLAKAASVPEAKTRKWLTDHDIRVSVWQTIGQLVATAGPVLGSGLLAGLERGL